ncbi:MAG: GUN4 domain-containing protein [Cyanobacteria bacterium P01_B01_bin.77]
MPRRKSESEVLEKIINALCPSIFGAAVLFSIYQETSKAIIGYSASLFLSLFTSYGKKFSEVLKDRLQNWAERDAKAFADFLSYGRQSIYLNISRFEYQYYQCLKVNCTEIEIEGLDDLAPLNLARIYVPLKAEAITKKGAYFSEQSNEIWHYLPKKRVKTEDNTHKRILIVAGPGYGKTTLLRHLCLMYVTGLFNNHNTKKLTPILLRCREIYQKIQTERAPSLPDLVENHIRTNPDLYPDLVSPKNWFHERLRRGECLVMLDGLDEVPDALREKLRCWMNFQMASYYRNQFILTSRPHGVEKRRYNEKFTPVKALRFKILPFNASQKTDFIEQWYSEDFFLKYAYFRENSKRKVSTDGLYGKILDTRILKKASIASKDLIREIIQNQALNKLAENPLLITMIVSTYQADKALARRREELYNQMSNLMLEGRPKKKGTPLSGGAYDNRAILQSLAFQLTCEEKSQFNIIFGSKLIREKLKERYGENSISPDFFIDEIHKIAGILVGKEGGLYEFIHKTFQEYFASAEIKVRQLESFMLSKLDDSNWSEVIRFYAAQYGADPIVEEALRKSTPHNISLAYSIINEDGSYVSKSIRAVLYKKISKMHLSLGELAPKLRLSQRFKDGIHINENQILSPDPITWGEYRLFLEDQALGQFHSKAHALDYTSHPEHQPVSGITWKDACWFCAWLSTQRFSQEESTKSQVYDYRLPSPQDALLCNKNDRHMRAFVSSPIISGNAIFVVQTVLPKTYQALIGYLANNRWQEANEETAKIMLDACNKNKAGPLIPGEIDQFPCNILQNIDRLWRKFSGEQFGFSVQRQVYLECGNALDGSYSPDEFENFRSELAWPKNNDFSKLKFTLGAPRGHLPWLQEAPLGYWIRLRKILIRVGLCL